MKKYRFLMLIILGVYLGISCQPTSDKGTSGRVTVIEDSLMVPTYVVNPPNAMPRFYEGQAHQGVQRRYYPYPMNDNLTREKEDRNYKIIYLENEFIKIGVMPGLGGRIFEAIDKTNGYHFFYRQHVIKPSLIGMVGYWISGGNAWGYPHHHGPHTVEPMDYTIEEHADGSATVWLSYVEQMHRLRILLGYTIFPGSSTVEMTIRPYNPTPNVCSFLFWANPSVHVDSTYQVIFPPSVEYVTQHHKSEMTTWPIADRRYNRYDYTGKDISLWKNTGVPSSFFSWNPQEDFFGGYDHGKQAGTAWIGNHHTSPGMKYWADGNNPAGRMINDGLTDNDGQYIELMAGAYTDNQPDYSWLQPYESKNETMTWYPIRMLSGLKEANKNAALNLTAEAGGKVSAMINTTRLYNKARVVLTYDGTEIHSETIKISPALPYVKELSLSAPVDEKKLKLALYDASGEAVIAYQPAPPPGNPMPESLKSPAPPEEMGSVEELYLTGLRLNQFHNASIDPYPYYFEALKRDPEDYRVNTQLGILYLQRKMFEEAEKHLQTADGRITMRYTRPASSEGLYYLGLVQRKLGKRKEAYDHLYAAAWNAGWHTQSYHQLAEMDCENGDLGKALDHIDRALSTNINHMKGLGLKVTLLRKLNRLDEAEALALKVLQTDRLDYQSRNELALIYRLQKKNRKAAEILNELDVIMQDHVQSYLEFSTNYANCGFFEEAREVLERLEAKGNTYPMLYYYLGYYSARLDDLRRSSDYFDQARTMPHNYCFPFRDESITVLNAALQYNEADAKALYYLGNLYYEQQPEKAISLWEESRNTDSTFYIVLRNLAWAARENEHNPEKAAALYGQAFTSNREDSRLMYEYDMVLANAGEQPKVRYERIFAGNRHVSAQHSSTYLREIELLIFLGKYDEVAQIIATTQFVESEGSRTFRDVYHNTWILKSLQDYAAGNYAAALDDIRKAIDFPIGRWGSERRAQMYYLSGLYQEKLGRSNDARADFEKAVAELVDGTEYHYEKGLAWEKLGEPAKAREQYAALMELANRRGDRDAFRSFEAGSAGSAQRAQNLYLRGLAQMGMGRKAEADKQFADALQQNPAHLWANFRLNY